MCIFCWNWGFHEFIKWKSERPANRNKPQLLLNKGFPGGLEEKNLPFNAGDIGSFPKLRRSPGEGNGNPVQYSCLWNSLDIRAWWGHRLRHNLVAKQQQSVQFSSVVSDSLQPHELQDARPPYPLPVPRVYPNSGPLSPWSHPTISSSVVSFSSCPQSFPASGSFQMSQIFISGGQSFEASGPISGLPMNIQDLFSLRLTGWISLQSKGLSESSPTPQFKCINSSALSFLYSPTLAFMTTGKTIALTIWTFVGRVRSLLFNMLSRLVIIFLPRSKPLLI